MRLPALASTSLLAGLITASPILTRSNNTVTSSDRPSNVAKASETYPTYFFWEDTWYVKFPTFDFLLATLSDHLAGIEEKYIERFILAINVVRVPSCAWRLLNSNT